MLIMLSLVSNSVNTFTWKIRVFILCSQSRLYYWRQKRFRDVYITASLRVNQKTHFVWIFFVLWAKYFVREIILQLQSINLYWNNFVPKETGNPCKYPLSCKLLMKITHSSHLFQCPSQKPCTEEKRVPNRLFTSFEFYSKHHRHHTGGMWETATSASTRERCPKEKKGPASSPYWIRLLRSLSMVS